MTTSATLKEQALKARAASAELATSSNEERNDALLSIAAALDERCGQVLDANAVDLAEAEQAGLGEHITERMTLNEERVADMAEALGVIAQLPDPIGEVLDETTRPNGLRVQRVSVPLGVIGTIYESRPNVTVDIASLCLKVRQRGRPPRRQRGVQLQQGIGEHHHRFSRVERITGRRRAVRGVHRPRPGT